MFFDLQKQQQATVQTEATNESETRLSALREALKSEVDRNDTTIQVTNIAPGNEADFELWWQIYNDLFTDPTDKEDLETIRDNWTNQRSDLVLIGASRRGASNVPSNGTSIGNGTTIGMRLVARSETVPDSVYVPYGGIIGEFQGIRCYTRALQVHRQAFINQGRKIVHNDCENPKRVSRFQDSYAEFTQTEIEQLCRKRLHFFCSQGYRFVDDDDLEYRRPASDDPSQIQQYDLCGFDILDKNFLSHYFRKNPITKEEEISKAGYKEMYLRLHCCDQYLTGADPLALQEHFPAIKSFLDDLENCSKDWFKLYQDPLVKG